jgi:hypothetical protein
VVTLTAAAFSGEESTSAGLHGLLERMERHEFDLIAVGGTLIGDRLGSRTFSRAT